LRPALGPGRCGGLGCRIPRDSREVPIRLLLLEDCVDDGDLLALELAAAGLHAEILRVATGAEFRSALAAFAPDIVVSDHDLPGFSGGEALDLTRMHDAALPFVILSGFVPEDRPADDRAHGADAWLCKDRMQEVPAVLQRLLSR
jgi:CheY-like chemotaxis protein